MLETYDLSAGERMCVTGSLAIANREVASLTKRGLVAAVFEFELCNSPVADLPTAKAPVLRIEGHMDGCAISFDRAETLVFPNMDGLSAAFRAARSAQAQLDACLANPSLKRRV